MKSMETFQVLGAISEKDGGVPSSPARGSIWGSPNASSWSSVEETREESDTTLVSSASNDVLVVNQVDVSSEKKKKAFLDL